jgi:hypothetical protein
MARTSIFQAILNRDGVDTQGVPTSDTTLVFRNTYQDKLRLVGSHLDQNNMKRMNILEVPGGMLVRAASADGFSEELLEFPESTFESHFETAIRQRHHDRNEYLRIKSELIPTSYSDVLRAIGAWLDDGLARSIVISEGGRGLYVTGLMLQETSIQSRYASFDEFFSPEAVDILLTEAYKRRKTEN